MDNFYASYPVTSGGGGGAVNSVTASGPLSSSGGANPDISLTGIVPIANGGTNNSTFTSGDLIYYDGTSLTDATGITTDGAGNLTITGNFSAANFPTPPFVGTPNTFAGFDGAGALETVPGFSINTTSGGMFINLTEQPNDGNGFTAHETFTAFDPLQNSPDENWNIYNIGVNFDINNSGFSQGTSGNAVQMLNLGFNHQNTGPIGQVVYHNLTAQFGNGTDPVTIGGMTGVGMGVNVNANATAKNNWQGYNFNLNLNAAAIADPTFHAIAFADFSQIGVAVNGYDDAVYSPNIAGINNNFNYNGVTVNPNIAALSGNAGYYGYGFYGSVGTIATGGVTGFNMNPAITTMGATSSLTGLNFGAQVATAHGNINGVSINPNMAAGDGNFNGVTINPNNTGSYVATNVTGISINLSNVPSTNQKQGLNINDGQLQVQSNYDTSVLPASPGFMAQNSIGGELHVVAGFPMTNTLSIGTNTGLANLFEDSMGPDAFGGFIGRVDLFNATQMAIAAGKTVDTYNNSLFAATIPVLGISGGTLSNANIVTVGGVFAQGADTFSITNLKGINVLPIFNSLGATNAWGVWVGDTTVDNWFSKNVIVGGSTGKPVAGEALGVTGYALVTENLPNDTAGQAADFTVLSNTTVNGSITTTGIQGTATGTVQTGAYNDKAVSGLVFTSERGDGTDDGILEELDGINSLSFLNSGAAGVTNKWNGVYTLLFLQQGTITNAYDFHSVTVPAGTGAVTNHYGLYIESGSTNPKQSWISGYTRLGGSSFVAPTADLHLPGVTAAAGTASLKIDSGTFMTTPENGAIESDGTNLMWTDDTGVRRQLNNASTPSSPTYTITNVNFGMSPYTVLTSDDILVVDTSGGDVVLNLLQVSTAVVKQLLITKDTADANNVVLTPFAGDTIAREVLQTMSSQDETVALYPNGVTNYIAS